MKNAGRKILRKILGFLTAKTIIKHKPVVICILGEGETAIAREILYANIHQKHPARRNLEIPEAEFTIPLTVLGILTYPKNIFEWLGVILKSFIRLAYLKPYSHYLIIEIPSINLDITKFWIKILNPKHTLLTSDFEYKKILGRSLKYKSVNDVLKKLNIKKIISEIPQPRIKILKERSGRTVVDATYFYTSTPMKSVLEVIGETKGQIVLFTDSQKDKEIALHNLKDITINPHKLELSNNDIVILRGRKGTINEKLQKELFPNI